MDVDLESALRRLAEQPLHPRLNELEVGVMCLIAAEQRPGRTVTMQSGMLATIFAIALGVASGSSLPSAAAQGPTLAPFGSATTLAPSSLLAFQ